VIEAAPPPHSGFGSGTQLGLAVARALAVAAGLAELDAGDLARRVKRGARSALGVHGFARGGFLVEGGQRAPGQLAPLVARPPFPEAWRVVLAVPPAPSGMHGRAEQQAFQALLARQPDRQDAEARCRLVLLGMLPALVEEDLTTFGEALHDFNARSGESFAAFQGGTYAGPLVAELVAFVRGQGVRGVGQSSWGPAVFAVVGDEERGRHLALQVQRHFALVPTQVFVTRASPGGAETGGG
jgi:beta-RFAP synthase